MKPLLVAAAAATALLVSACGGGSSPEASPSSPAATTAAPSGSATDPAGAQTLTIKGFAFQPATLTVPVGTTVRVTNEDDATHTWTSDGNWDSGDLEKGESFTFVFKEKGTFSFDCTPHPSMKGTVTVT